jgi:putative holliday junction resolvase
MSITVPASGGRIPANVASDTKARRILAIDYGRKRIGLALSDELGITARPLATIHRVNRREELRRLREICRNHSVALIIVGHPLHMSGEAGEMAAEAAGFAKKLEREMSVKVELVDERLTSWEARQTMAQTKSASRRKRGSLDDVAAAILLRDYLGRGLERGLDRKRPDAHSKFTENH